MFGCFGAPPAGIAGAERPQQLQHCLRWGWLHDAQTPQVFFWGRSSPRATEHLRLLFLRIGATVSIPLPSRVAFTLKPN